MSREHKLSGEARDFIDNLASSQDMSPQELEEEEKFTKLVKAVVDDLINSREMLIESKLASIEKIVASHPDLIASFLDERFTREVIDAVPGNVRRTMELSRLEGSRIPSSVTDGYLREAVRTYILGLPQASIALCRAALEQAIKENLGYRTSTVVEMNSLLDEAETAHVIDKTVRRMAREVATEANGVLHEKPSTQAKAYEVLVKLRGVLQHLYSE